MGSGRSGSREGRDDRRNNISVHTINNEWRRSSALPSTAGRWPTPVNPQVHGLMVTAASPAHLYIMRKSRQRLQDVLDRAKRLAEVRGCLENLNMTPVIDPSTPPQAAPQQSQPRLVSSQAQVMLEEVVTSIDATERELGLLGDAISAVSSRFETLDQEHQRSSVERERPDGYMEAIQLLCTEKERLSRQEGHLWKEKRRLSRR